MRERACPDGSPQGSTDLGFDGPDRHLAHAKKFGPQELRGSLNPYK